MLFDANMKFTFWGEAVTTANSLQNKLPWKNVHKTPYLVWKKTSIYEFETCFGANCYVKIPDINRKKLDPKISKGILLGFYMESKAYRIYVPSSRKVVISRDEKNSSMKQALLINCQTN